MGESQLRGNVIQGDGVYKTTDAGKTWTHVGLEKTLAIARIRVHPSNPDVVFVAALGNPYGPSPDRGVYRSTDGGKTWEQRAVPRRAGRRGGPRASIPRNPDVLYAAIWEAFRTPHSLSSGGPDSGTVQVGRRRHHVDRTSRGTPGCPRGVLGQGSALACRGADGRRV